METRKEILPGVIYDMHYKEKDAFSSAKEKTLMLAWIWQETTL
jgi:hypothetical protein